jgi:transposase InsO family protein
LDKWAYDNKVTLDFSRPGKPTDNADESSLIHLNLLMAASGMSV